MFLAVLGIVTAMLARITWSVGTGLRNRRSGQRPPYASLAPPGTGFFDDLTATFDDLTITFDEL